MDICVQLTCGQGQHAGSVQHEENQADIQDGFHFPKVGFYLCLDPSSSCCCDVAFLFPPILERNYAQWKEEKQHGFKLNAPDFINKTTLRSEGAR